MALTFQQHNPSAGLSKATLAASRRPFQGNSRSYTPQPSVFKRFKTAVCPPKPLKTLKPFRSPFQGNSCSFPQAFPRQLSQLQAPDNASNPSAGLSKATLAATGPKPSIFKGVQDCRLPALKPLKPSRRPFQDNSRSFPQAFPRQLSQLQAPDTASNPSASLSKATLAATRPSHLFFKRFARPQIPQNLQTLPHAFPRQLLQLPASLSKATLAATGPRQCFKPFRKPFQGNSRSFPQAFPRQLSQLQAPDTARNPSTGLSKANLAATHPSHLFLRDSRLPFARPQTLQTLPQAFPRQLSQLPAGLSKALQAPDTASNPSDCRLPALKPLKPFKPWGRPFQGNSRSYTPQPSVFKRFKIAVCPPSKPSNPSNHSAGLSKATLAASRKPFQGNSRSYRPQTMLQTLLQAFPRQLS